MAKRVRKIDESEIKALIAAEIRDAAEYQDTEVAGDRERAINYYNGEMPDTPNQPGWSSFKSRDTADVMGWVLPGVIRVFSASDRMVDYQPQRPGDEEFTDQASDYANYVFWVDNNGYRVLWDATHDSLLLADGIVKTWWDDSEEAETSVHSGLMAEDIAILTEDPDVEVIAATEKDAVETGMLDEMGMPIMAPLYDVKIKRVTSRGRLRIDAIEPENFLIDKESITIEDARFVAHRDPHMTRSKLVEMGFDKDKVEAIPRYSGSLTGMQPERNARRVPMQVSMQGDPAYDRIELYECYVRVDVNGDGIAETVLAYYAGNNGAGELLDWEVYDDENPFNQIPCYPVPHRFASQSIADKVMDMQQIKTVLFRQLLDNAYQVNNPQKQVRQNSVLNMDEVVNPTVGGVIVLKDTGQPVEYSVTPSILGDALGTIQAMDSVIEMRTGVSRATQALDPETLQNQSATASNNNRDAAYSQIELIARNMAELGWKKVFGKMLRLIVKHQDRPRTIRLRDKWVQIDPRVWNVNMDAQINVGLGTGSRDRDMAMLNNISMTQIAMTDRLAAAGYADKALDMLPKIVKTLTRIVEAAGIKNADSYYPEISEEDLQMMKQQAAEAQGQPDPKVMAEMQARQQEMQLQAQKAQADAELQRQKIAADAEIKRMQIEAEIALKREQLAAELQLKREQLQAELSLKAEMGVLNAQAKVATSGVNIGGDPG